jgi:hypothetical protein
MEAIRQIVEVRNNRLNILLPADFKAETVEIIILPIEKSKDLKKNKPSHYSGCISKETAESMLIYVEESRKEWERDS